MQAILRQGGSVTRAAYKFLKVLLLILLYFLLQTVVMPHLKIAGIMPNLLMVIIAIMTVSYGKLYAFISGAMVGIILEAMSYSIPLFYLLIYPVLALLCAQVFADMSDIKREMRRIREAQRLNEVASEIKAPFIKKKVRFHLFRSSPYDLNAHLRIFLNTLMLVFLYDGIMLVYVAISGVGITFNHIARVFYAAAYTALCCLTMFPVRAWLGLYKRRKKLKAEDGAPELSTSRETLRQLAIVPDEIPEQKKPGFQFFRRKPLDASVSQSPQASGEPDAITDKEVPKP